MQTTAPPAAPGQPGRKRGGQPGPRKTDDERTRIVNVTLDPTSLALASAAGAGNVSRGIRAALLVWAAQAPEGPRETT